MKALSIKEPWASLIFEGRKTIETRTWKTGYRGRLLLCASKSPKGKLSGRAFAHCNLIGCRPMVKADEAEACCGVYDGAYAWVLEDVIPMPAGREVKGRLGLFEVEGWIR